MAKSIFYHLFGLGKIPKRYRRDIEQEGVVFKDEGLSIVLRYRHFRAPRVYYSRKISLIVGSVVLTKKRFACYRGNIIPPVFDVPVEHEAFKAFELSLDDKARLQVVIDAPTFQEGWEGRIDCRIPSDDAEHFLRALSSLRKRYQR